MTDTVADTVIRELKQTPFHEFHQQLGAKMVSFAGYQMPIQYSGIIAEHRAVRENVGLFDLSHMGEVFISGADSLEFLQRLTCNDVSALAVGQIQYTAMLNEAGGFVDDLLLYRLENEWLLVINASNIAKDVAWMNKQVQGEVKIDDRSDDYGLLAIQGPEAQQVMARVTDYDLDSLPYYHQTMMTLAGEPILVSRTGYTGEDGFEIYLPRARAADIWQVIKQAGEKSAMTHIGLGARDSLRLEMKMALYGSDMDETITPLEAGLSWIVKLDKGDFIGKSALLEQKERGLSRRLVCLEFSGRVLPRHGYQLLEGAGDDGGAEVGVVTSGAFSPSLQKPIAMGFVKRSLSKSGSQVSIVVREKLFSGTVVKPPFYKHGSHR